MSFGPGIPPEMIVSSETVLVVADERKSSAQIVADLKKEIESGQLGALVGPAVKRALTRDYSGESGYKLTTRDDANLEKMPDDPQSREVWQSVSSEGVVGAYNTREIKVTDDGHVVMEFSPTTTFPRQQDFPEQFAHVRLTRNPDGTTEVETRANIIENNPDASVRNNFSRSQHAEEVEAFFWPYTHNNPGAIVAEKLTINQKGIVVGREYSIAKPGASVGWQHNPDGTTVSSSLKFTD